MSGWYACLLLLLLLLLFSSSVHSQSTFERGERIPLLYNKIFSHRTLLPYSYASLPFICPPYTEEDWSHKSRMSSWLAVDQDWFGDYPILSDYKVKKIDWPRCLKYLTLLVGLGSGSRGRRLPCSLYEDVVRWRCKNSKGSNIRRLPSGLVRIWWLDCSRRGVGSDIKWFVSGQVVRWSAWRNRIVYKRGRHACIQSRVSIGTGQGIFL